MKNKASLCMRLTASYRKMPSRVYCELSRNFWKRSSSLGTSTLTYCQLIWFGLFCAH